MRKLVHNTAKLFIALMIPAMFLVSCNENEDVVAPSIIPPKGDIVTPPQKP